VSNYSKTKSLELILNLTSYSESEAFDYSGDLSQPLVEKTVSVIWCFNLLGSFSFHFVL